MTEFKILPINSKWGNWWAHIPSNTCRFFDNREANHSNSEWSFDEFAGRVGGWSADMKLREWTLDDVAAHFKRFPEEWKSFEIKWHSGFRENRVVFL